METLTSDFDITLSLNLDETETTVTTVVSDSSETITAVTEVSEPDFQIENDLSFIKTELQIIITILLFFVISIVIKFVMNLFNDVLR